MALRHRHSFNPKGTGCVQLLRIDKRMYSKANTLLYSNNRFRFPEVITSTPSVTDSTHIASLIHQMGSQARHIRHICIPIPTFDYPQPDRAGLHKTHIKI